MKCSKISTLSNIMKSLKISIINLMENLQSALLFWEQNYFLLKHESSFLIFLREEVLLGAFIKAWIELLKYSRENFTKHLLIQKTNPVKVICSRVKYWSLRLISFKVKWLLKNELYLRWERQRRSWKRLWIKKTFW